jgi:hypothetical protein
MLPNFLDEQEDTIFPDRKDLKKIFSNEKVIYNDIVEQAKKIELDKVNFETEDFKPRADITQKQRVFLWVRFYLKNEIELEPNTTIFIHYTPLKEKLETKFICYAKKGLDRDHQDEVVNYTDEDDKRVLCVMIDEDRINKNNEDIDFLKRLFKLGRFFEPIIYHRNELQLTTEKGDLLDYFDIDF